MIFFSLSLCYRLLVSLGGNGVARKYPLLAWNEFVIFSCFCFECIHIHLTLTALMAYLDVFVYPLPIIHTLFSLY
jgi:hypothetical protein